MSMIPKEFDATLWGEDGSPQLAAWYQDADGETFKVRFEPANGGAIFLDTKCDEYLEWREWQFEHILHLSTLAQTAWDAWVKSPAGQAWENRIL